MRYFLLFLAANLLLTVYGQHCCTRQDHLADVPMQPGLSHRQVLKLNRTTGVRTRHVRGSCRNDVIAQHAVAAVAPAVNSSLPHRTTSVSLAHALSADHIQGRRAVLTDAMWRAAGCGLAVALVWNEMASRRMWSQQLVNNRTGQVAVLGADWGVAAQWIVGHYGPQVHAVTNSSLLSVEG